MTFKNQLGAKTEQLEKQVLALAPHYTSLEPWQRGLLLIALTLFLLFSIYYLTSTTSTKKQILQTKAQREKEALAEERLLKQMVFFKKLQS